MQLDPRIKEYCKKADDVRSEDALRRLCEIYIAACGMSVGERSLAACASHYWVHRYNDEHPDATQLKNLKDAMSALSEEYNEDKERIDRYYPSPLDPEDVVRIYNLMIDDYTDELTSIALSMGVMFFLSYLLLPHSDEE